MINCQLYRNQEPKYKTFFRSRLVSLVNIENFETYLCKKCFVKSEKVLKNLKEQVQQIHGNMSPRYISKYEDGQASKYKQASFKRSQSLTYHNPKYKETYDHLMSLDEYRSKRQLISRDRKKRSTKTAMRNPVKKQQHIVDHLEKQKYLFSLDHVRDNNSCRRSENYSLDKNMSRVSNRVSSKHNHRHPTRLEVQKDSFSLDHLRGYISRNRLGNKYPDKYLRNNSNRTSIESDRCCSTDREEDKNSYLLDSLGFRTRNVVNKTCHPSLTLFDHKKFSPETSSISKAFDDSYDECDQWNLRKAYSNVSSPTKPRKENNVNSYNPNFSNEGKLLNLHNGIITNSSYFSYLQTDFEDCEFKVDMFLESNESLLKDLKEVNLLNQSYRHFFKNTLISSQNIENDNCTFKKEDAKEYTNKNIKTNDSTGLIESTNELATKTSFTLKVRKMDELLIPKCPTNNKIELNRRNLQENINEQLSNNLVISQDQMDFEDNFTSNVTKDDELLFPYHSINTEKVSTMNEKSKILTQAKDFFDDSQPNVVKADAVYIKHESKDDMESDVTATVPLPNVPSDLLYPTPLSIAKIKIESELIKENFEDVGMVEPKVQQYNPLNQSLKEEVQLEENSFSIDSKKFNPIQSPNYCYIKGEDYDSSYYENLNYSWPTDLDSLFS